MPIPKPRAKEKQSVYHGRCMDAIWPEYKDEPNGMAQANAICYSTWQRRKKDRKKKAEQIVKTGNFLQSNDPATAPKASKQQAIYVNHPVNDHFCLECVMFEKPDGCSAVAGKISPNGHCKYWQGHGTDNLDRALRHVLGKMHHTIEGIDPENARSVSFPIAPDNVRAEVTHIAWHQVADLGKKIEDFPIEMVPFDKTVATQPEVDEKRVEQHAKDFEADGGYDDYPIVVELDGLFYIIDGHHRSEGAKEAGAEGLEMRTINGDATTGKADAPVAALLDIIGKGVQQAPGTTISKAEGAPPKQLLIGLVGPSGSHKTKASKHLAKAHDFKRIHAGEPVKLALRKGFRLKKKQTAKKAKDQPTLKLGGATPRAALEATGDGIHDVAPHATSRIMQKRIVKRLAKGHSVVVDGVRTPEEADTIHRLGGSLVRVNNGKDPDPRKPMDMRQKDMKCDAEIDSSQGKAHLRKECDGLMHKMGMPVSAS